MNPGWESSPIDAGLSMVGPSSLLIGYLEQRDPDDVRGDLEQRPPRFSSSRRSKSRVRDGVELP